MALPFFENAIQSGISSGNPGESYRDMLQAYVNEQWDNTTALQDLFEQDSIGSDEYSVVEAMVANLIDLTSTGRKVGRDFIRLFFRDFSHEVIQGRYYKYNNDYWLIDDVSLHEGVAPLVTLRRCNNSLRMIDPQSGKIFSAPCNVNYDMTSPMAHVSRYVITPNNHAEIIVQANSDTMRLFKLNTRFILGGRPFKLLSYQNTLLDNLDNQVPTILYLDLYLDEIHAKDDLENRIADNGTELVADVSTDDGIYLVPSFSSIRKYESKEFTIVLKQDGNSYDISNTEAEITLSNSSYARVVSVGNDFEMYCNAVSKEPITMTINIPSKNISQTFDIDCVSMIGG